MAEVFHIRAFQKAREECARANFGPNVTRAIYAAVREEQRDGKTGSQVAGDLAMLRMRATARGIDPKPAA